MSTNNPLLEQHTLPPFSYIQTEHILPAVESRIQHVFDVLAAQLAVIEQGAYTHMGKSCWPIRSSI